MIVSKLTRSKNNIKVNKGSGGDGSAPPYDINEMSLPPNNKRSADACEAEQYLSMDFNCSRHFGKRPMTISSSHAQMYKKKKNGFDEEQCSFVRINDIIFSFSGNVFRTYDYISTTADKMSPQSRDTLTPKRQSSETKSPIHYRPGCISEIITNFLLFDNDNNTKKGTLSKQADDLDTFDSQNFNESLFQEEDLFQKSTRSLKNTTGSRRKMLWYDLKRFGSRQKQQKLSLFEMIIENANATADSSSKQKLQGYFGSFSYDDTTGLSSNVSVCSSQGSIISKTARSGELDLKTVTRTLNLRKKFVSIKEPDGSVHHIRPEIKAESYNEEQLPSSDVIRQPLSVSRPNSSQSAPRQSMDISNMPSRSSTSFWSKFKNDPNSVPNDNKTTVGDFQACKKTLNPNLLTPGMFFLRRDSETASSKESSLQSISSRNTSNNSIHANSLVKSFSLTFNDLHSASKCHMRLLEETEVVVLHREVWQARLQVGLLRHQSEYLKKESQYLQKTSAQLPNQQTLNKGSVVPGYAEIAHFLLQFISAFVVGVIFGKFVF